jgi:hypothetical protein
MINRKSYSFLIKNKTHPTMIEGWEKIAMKKKNYH